MASSLKILISFVFAFSLLTLPGALHDNFGIPTIGLVHGLTQACETHTVSNSCSEYWYPAGPAMNTELATIFVDGTAEFNNMISASPTIDFADWTLDPSLVPSATSNPNLRVTAPIASHTIFEIQFMLANTFWGCPFSFGNSLCGQHIRQGIAHLIDRGKFASNTTIFGFTARALDSPVPSRQIPSANPCAWDIGTRTSPNANLETGTDCRVGAPGGTAYHLGSDAGPSPSSGQPNWIHAPGSIDEKAAAQHFVDAGVATGLNPATGVLTGVNTTRAGFPVDFFVRNDDPTRLALGNSLASAVCYLFTGSYTLPCPPYLTRTLGPITAFQGFITSPTTTATSWHMYTSADSFNGLTFDDYLYFARNSVDVSGNPSNQPPCSANAVGSYSAGNYMYLCNPSYDNISNQMEFSPCLTANGDPTPGQITPTFANCPGTSQLSAASAGYQTEDLFGKNAFTLPVFTLQEQYAYLNGWQHAINDDGWGTPNYFTWLNAYNGAPAQAGTLRQGFRQGTHSVNPYIAETFWDFFIIGNIYDSLAVTNPMGGAQVLGWMTVASQQMQNSQLTYTPPGGGCNSPGGTCTFATFRYTLRSDLFFQDGRKLTAFDVAFSYLSMKATGAFGSWATEPMLGVTILSPTQFDLNLNNFGPFTGENLRSITIEPGRYWTSVGQSSWDTSVTGCTGASASCFPAQYTLASFGTLSLVNCALTCTFGAGNLNIDTSKITATYDPIKNGILIGSGPWQCGNGSNLGSACTTGGVQNPQVGQSYTLTRFGNGFQPASSISGMYFRSNGNLALWIWSQNTGRFTQDFLNFGVVAACFGLPPQPLPGPGVIRTGCAHFQQGIGANGVTTPGGTDGCPVSSTCGIRVGINQVAAVNRFVGLNWVSPFDWASSPPLGIVPFPPVLHEGSATMSPASLLGCSSAYPSGGYDC